MICPNCGQEVREGAAFCMNCGTPVNSEAPAQQAPVQEAPVAPVEPTAPVTYEEPVTYAAPEAPAVKPKKKKKLLKWLIPAVVAVAAAVAVVLNLSFLQGFFLKTFGADEDYYSFVEEKALEEGTDLIAEAYGAVLDAAGGEVEDQKATMTVSFTLGEQLLAMLDAAPAQVGDVVELINGAKYSVTANVKDNKIQMLVGIAVSGDETFDVEAIVDMENGDVYVGAPNSEKEYIKFEGVLEEAFADVKQVLSDEELQKVLEALPTEKEIATLLDRYVKAVFDSLEKGDVETKSTTLEVGDVSQKCTQIDVKITPALGLRIVKNVLTEAKDDKDIKKIITRVYDAIADLEMMEGAPFDSADELYENLTEVLDEALESLDDVDAEDEEVATLTTYVDGAHGIIGRELTANDETVLFVATAEKGKKTASKLSVMNDMILIEGGGEKKGNLINATYEVIVREQVLGTIELKEFNEKKAEDGYLNGTIVIRPDAKLMELVAGSASSSVIGSVDPALEMIFNTSEKKADVTINLLANEEVLVGLTMTGEQSKATAVKIPENTVDGMDEDALMAWAGDDPMALLEELGVPSAVLDMAEELMGAVKVPEIEFGSDVVVDDDYYSSDVVAGDVYGYY